jgi:hypothetical protein
MLIHMSDNPIFPKVVNCGDVHLPIVNCEYWSFKETCKTNCGIGLKETPSTMDCFTCTSRKSFNNKLVLINEENKVVQVDENITVEKKNGEYNILFLGDKNKEESIKKVEYKEKRVPQEEKHFIDKAKTYLAAEGSQVSQGKVPQNVFEKRKKICMQCEFRYSPEYKNKEKPFFKDSIGWCRGGCGCGVGTPRAALSVKLYMPTLSCPKGKFGPESGAGFNISDAVDSAKGIVKSVANLFKKEDSDK